MQRKVHISEKKIKNLNDMFKVQDNKKKIKVIKGKKISKEIFNDKNQQQQNISSKVKSKKVFLLNIFTKQNIVCVFLTLVDIILIICFARKNVVNYVEVVGEEIFVSETRYLFFGRNYITLMVTFFFYIYTLATQRLFFKQKITRKYLVITFFFYFILNIVLFWLFTKRIY